MSYKIYNVKVQIFGLNANALLVCIEVVKSKVKHFLLVEKVQEIELIYIFSKRLVL